MKLRNTLRQALAMALSAQVVACGGPPADREGATVPASSGSHRAMAPGPGSAARAADASADEGPLAAFANPKSNTGAFQTSVPFPLPAGFSGLSPELQLNYSSQAASGLAGVGWDLALPALTLTTNDGARPPTVADDLDIYGRDGRPLERYDSPHGRIAVQRTASGVRYFINPHSGVRVEPVADWSGAIDRSGEVAAWKITTPDGRAYYYGTTLESSHVRQFASGGSTPARKVIWLLQRVEDPSGNQMLYRYTSSPVPGVVQPALVAIEYGLAASAASTTRALVVKLEYRERPTRRRTFTHGTALDEGALLKRVCSYAGTRYAAVQNGSAEGLERCWELTYDFEGATARSYTERPLLVAVTEKAADGSARPPWVFSYTHQGESWKTGYAQSLAGGGTPWSFPLGGPADPADDAGMLGTSDRGTRATMADVNGDGIPDGLRGRADGTVDVALATWEGGAVTGYDATRFDHPLAAASPAGLDATPTFVHGSGPLSHCWHTFEYDVRWRTPTGLGYAETLTRGDEEFHADRPLGAFVHLSSAFMGTPPDAGKKDHVLTASTIDELEAFGSYAPNPGIFDYRGSDCQDWNNRVKIDHCWNVGAGRTGTLGADLACFDEPGARWFTGYDYPSASEGYSADLWRIADLDGDGLHDWVFAAPMVVSDNDGTPRDLTRDRDWYWAPGNGHGWDPPRRWRVPSPTTPVAGASVDMVHDLGMLEVTTQRAYGVEKPAPITLTPSPGSPLLTSVSAGGVSFGVGMPKPGDTLSAAMGRMVSPIDAARMALGAWALGNGVQDQPGARLFSTVGTIQSVAWVANVTSAAGAAGSFGAALSVLGPATVAGIVFSVAMLVRSTVKAFETDDTRLSTFTHEGLRDVTGDGRPDLVVARYDAGADVNLATEWLLYRNDGAGGFADPVRFPIHAPTGTHAKAALSVAETRIYQRLIADLFDDGVVVDATTATFGSVGTQQELVDLNGDGLDDLVTLAEDTAWEVALNHGEGFAKPMAWRFEGTPPACHAGQWISLFGFAEVSSRESRAIEQLMDVNGDGLPDYVEVDTAHEGSCYGAPSGDDDFHSQVEALERLVDVDTANARMFVRLNLGDRFGERQLWVEDAYPLAGTRQVGDERVMLSVGDWDADGAVDLAAHTGANGYTDADGVSHTVPENDWRLFALRATNPDALAKLVTPEGGVVEPAYAYVHEPSGDMAHGVWVVDQLRVRDHAASALTSLDVTHRFRYEGARTDRRDRRHFLGFERVYQFRDADAFDGGGYTLSRYYQDAAFEGQLYCREVRRTELSSDEVLSELIAVDRAAWAAAGPGATREGYEAARGIGPAWPAAVTSWPSPATRPSVDETYEGIIPDRLAHTGPGPSVLTDLPADDDAEGGRLAGASWGTLPDVAPADDERGPVTLGTLPEIVGIAPMSARALPAGSDWLGGGLDVSAACTHGGTVGRTDLTCELVAPTPATHCGDADDPGVLLEDEFFIREDTSGEPGLYVPRLRYAFERDYDAAGSDPRTIETEYAYDDFGNMIQTFEHGDVAIAGDERTTVRTMAAPNLSRYVVDRACDTVVTGASGDVQGRQRFGYDGSAAGACTAAMRGLLTSDEVAVDATHALTTTRTYDANGMMVREVRPRGETQTIYDPLYPWFPVEVRTLGGAVVRTELTGYAGVNRPRSAGGFGAVVEQIDASGASTRATLDRFGRVVAEYVPGVTPAVVSHSYVEATTTTPAEHVTRSLRGGAVAETRVRVTGFGISGFARTTPTTNNASCVAPACTTVVRDETRRGDGLVVSEVVPYFDVGGVAPDRIQTTRDPLGRVTRVINPDGSQRRTFYDRARTTEVDEVGRTHDSVRDARGFVIESTAYDDSGAAYQTVASELRPDGKPRSVADALGNRWTYRYDQLGRVVESRDPDQGQVEFARDDLTGVTVRTSERTRTHGVVVVSETDALGRTIREREYSGAAVSGTTVTGGTLQVESTWTYDRDVRTLVGASLLCAANYPVGWIARAERRERRGAAMVQVSRKDACYDAMGRTTEFAHTIEGTLYRTRYQYDEQGDVVVTTLPTGAVLRTTRDVTGFVTASTLDASVIASGASADARGAVDRVRLGNGITRWSCRDVMGRVRRVIAGDAAVSFSCGADEASDALTGTPVWSASYHHGGDGRLASRTLAYVDPTSTTTEASTTAYAYDHVGRLSEQDADGVVTAYQYDVVDNLIAQGGATYTLGDPSRGLRGAGPHAVAAGGGYALSYDGEGNAHQLVTPHHLYDLTWSAGGRVTKVVRDGGLVAEMSYDESGNRVSKRGPSGTSIYAGAVRVTPSETIASLDFEARQVTRGSRKELYWAMSDQVGSLAALLDERGALVQVAENDAFGAARTAATFDPIPSDGLTPHTSVDLLTGKERDAAFAPEDEVFDFGARIYVAPLGRWLSLDPLFVDGLNRYAYVRNNPANLTDPDGRATPQMPTVVMPNDTFVADPRAPAPAGQRYVPEHCADEWRLAEFTTRTVVSTTQSILVSDMYGGSLGRFGAPLTSLYRKLSVAFSSSGTGATVGPDTGGLAAIEAASKSYMASAHLLAFKRLNECELVRLDKVVLTNRDRVVDLEPLVLVNESWEAPTSVR